MVTNELIEKTRASIKERRFQTLLAKPQSGVYLFFSFDLANATQFKTSYPANWPVVVTRFYELIITELTTRLSSTIVWKFVGDEVLFFKQITQRNDLHIALPAAHAAMLATIDVLHKGFPYSRELLAVKGTIWVAEAQPILPADARKIESLESSPRNIIVETGRSPSMTHRDFLGPEVDIGFRISKFALRRRLVVSAELACLLYRERAEYVNVEKQLRIISFQVLKGVWKGRHYPIVWYEPDWENIAKTFLFDEHLNSEIAAAVKNKLSDDSKLETIEKVFSDLGRTEEIDELAAALKRVCNRPEESETQIEIPKDRYAEIHCAAVCFSPDGKILAAKRPSTKRRYPSCFEFGCGQLRLDESFGDCLRRAYRDDFGVEIKLPDPLIPIRVYEIHDVEERRIIPGIIFIADIHEIGDVERNYSRQKHTEIIWIEPNDSRLGRLQFVPNSKDTIASAVNAWNQTKH